MTVTVTVAGAELAALGSFARYVNVSVPLKFAFAVYVMLVPAATAVPFAGPATTEYVSASPSISAPTPGMVTDRPAWTVAVAVSYTHLTLPTILRV